MNAILNRRDRCRLCNQIHLTLALPLAASPIADAYVTPEMLNEEQGIYPLDLYLCLDCGHIQNIDIVDPNVLFRDYTFVTSSSNGLLDHYKQYANEVVAKFDIPTDSLVIEIGSNDGSLLGFFKNKGLKVLGVDPARAIAEAANLRGIRTLPEFFTLEIAERIREEFGLAELITANNVFAHADDLEGMVKGISTLLSNRGIFIFEVSYLPDIIDRFLFDTVYHEHVSYHSLAPLVQFFDRLGLQLFDVERIGSKGGSIRGFVRKSLNSNPEVTSQLTGLIRAEALRDFDKLATYLNYSIAVEARKTALNSFLDKALSNGHTIAGYGASTTVTTLMWHFELTEKIGFLVDDNPNKNGLFAPRCHIPVFGSDEIYSRLPNCVVILAWNFADQIIKRHLRFLNDGGIFVLPLPDFKIISIANYSTAFDPKVQTV